MKMRAKLTIVEIRKYGDAICETLVFDAKYDPANSPEDNSYSKYTPSAQLTMCVTNPALVGTFKAGETFYVDFIPCVDVMNKEKRLEEITDRIRSGDHTAPLDLIRELGDEKPVPPKPTVGPESGTTTKGA